MNNWTLLQMLGGIPVKEKSLRTSVGKLYERNIRVLGPRGNTRVIMESTSLWEIRKPEWISTKSSFSESG